MVNKSRTASLIILAAVPPPIYAQGAYLYQESYGVAVPLDADNYTQGLIRNANEHPNATRSINFKPFESVPEDKDIGALRDVQWTWRVNVTDFSAPNAENLVTTPIGFDATDFVNPHVVNTVYDFTWPGGGNISSALNHSTEPFCISTLDMIGMPANVSNAYTESNTNSTDCGPILGDLCVKAITDTLSSLPGENGCYSSTFSWFSSCESTLGYAYLQTPKHRSATETEDINNASNSSDGTRSGEGFWGAMSDASNGTNTTTYEAAVNQLQVMLITPVFGSDRPTPQLLCMRVNTSHLPEEEEEAGGKSAGVSVKYHPGVGMVVVLGWIMLAIAHTM